APTARRNRQTGPEPARTPTDSACPPNRAPTARRPMRRPSPSCREYRAYEVGDDRLGDRKQTAATEPLHTAGGDQNPHRGSERAGERTDDKDADRQQHDRPPAVNIRELAEQ